MDELILSISPTQVKNENYFPIAEVFSQARRSSLTIKNLDMLIFTSKNIQLHEQFNDEYIKDEDINLTEDYLESNNDLESIQNKYKYSIALT